MNTTGEAYGRVARTELTPEELERIVEEVGEEVIEVAPVETQGYATVGEIDMSHNAERKAYEIADRRVEELKKQNEKRFIFNPKRIVRTIWGFKGTHRSLLNQAREDIRQAGDVNAIDEGFDARARRRYGEAICEQFFNGSEEAIDTVAGEKREFFADNHEATVEARQLYVEFAESDSMSDDEFNSRLQEVRRKMGESLSDTATGEVVLDNYLEVARAMRGRRQHGEAMDSVAEGFRLMRGEARSDSRTEIHRTKVDKALDRYEDSRFGNIIPSQVLAAGISVGAWLATRGASTIARATAFVGGGAVIGAVVGAREHAEITRQRAMRERETFRGKEYEDGTRRERELSEFEYNRRNVDVILSDLNESLEQLRGGDFGKRAIDATLDRLAEVQTLKDMSAELGIDLFDHGVSDDPTKHLTDRMSIAEAQAELKVLIAQAIESGDTDTLDAFGITDINMVGDPAEFLDEMLARRSEAFAERITARLGTAPSTAPDQDSENEGRPELTDEMLDEAHLENARFDVNGAREQWATASAKRQGRAFSLKDKARDEIRDDYHAKVQKLGILELDGQIADTDDATAKNAKVITFLFDEQKKLRELTTEKLKGTKVGKFVAFMNKGSLAQRIAKGVGLGL